MKFGSLFTGVGGFDLGLERAGMRCEWQAEIDPHCRRELDYHWPSHETHPQGGGTLERFEDVRNVGEFTEPVDLVCGGFPCQDISVAGNRKGLAGERSGLWSEFRRVLEGQRPEWVLIENVPNLLSVNGGRDMGAVIGALAQLGYDCAWRVLDSQYFGVPQRRRRLFIVGRLAGGASAAQVLLEPKGMRRDSAEVGAAGPEAPGRVTGGVAEDREYADRPIARCLSAGDSVGRFDGDSETFVVGALGASDGGADDNDARTGKLVTTGPLACTSASQPDDNAAMARHIIPFDETQVTHPENRSRCEPGSPSHTLPTSGRPPAIAYHLRPASGQSQEEGLKADETSVAAALSASGLAKVADRGTRILGQAVRRLTPTECERLQGFPDGWTRRSSDTQRYRQMGNAVTVPVAQWIGARIMRVHNGEDPNQ